MDKASNFLVDWYLDKSSYGLMQILRPHAHACQIHYTLFLQCAVDVYMLHADPVISGQSPGYSQHGAVQLCRERIVRHKGRVIMRGLCSAWRATLFSGQLWIQLCRQCCHQRSIAVNHNRLVLTKRRLEPAEAAELRCTQPQTETNVWNIKLIAGTWRLQSSYTDNKHGRNSTGYEDPLNNIIFMI